MQQIYAEPIKPELITERLRQLREAGVTVAGALSPQRTQQHWKTVVDAGRRPLRHPRHDGLRRARLRQAEPLNLKRFIYELDVPVIVGGAALLHGGPAPHAHRRRRRARRLRRRSRAHDLRTALGIQPRWPRPSPTSPAPGATTSTSPVVATSTSSPTAGSARPATSSRRSPASADAVMLGAALARATDAPGGGYHWGPEAHHPQLPRGERISSVAGLARGDPLRPGKQADGTTNIIGALRRAMATTGYSDVKEFQRVLPI